MFPAILASLFPILGDVLAKVIPDKPARDAAVAEIAQRVSDLDMEVLKGQNRLNEVQAASQSLFVSGGRPFILWGSGIIFFYVIALYPQWVWVARIWGWPEPPPVDAEIVYALLTSILGLSGIRGYEKARGVARSK